MTEYLAKAKTGGPNRSCSEATPKEIEYMGGEGPISLRDFNRPVATFESFRRGGKYDGIIGTP